MPVLIKYNGLGGKLRFSGTSTGGFKARYVSSAAPLLLDAYPGAAAAYSLRKLSSTYNGSAIRVRRSSDNAETDIGFVNNVLDTASLNTFVGASTGYIPVWYDQSGNARNVSQTTALNQPVIIQSGVLVTDGGKVAVIPNQSMNFTAISVGGINYAGYSVMSRTSASNIITSFSGNGSPFISLIYSNSFAYNQNLTNEISYSFTSTGRFLFSTLNISNTQSAYLNGTLKTVSTITNTISNAFDRLLSRAASEPFVGKTQEHVLYLTNQSTNNDGINSNINSYYTIY
jgi:hypothetical protein